MCRWNQIFLVVISILLSACASAPPNLDEVKTQLKEYKTSGRYEHDLNVKIAKAEKYIVKEAGEFKKPAIILDIDETSLSNWPQLVANDLTFILSGPCENLPEGPCGIKAWQIRAEARAFPATLHLYETAKRHNVAVFFITGRMESERAATIRNLKQAGYKDWNSLIMRPPVLRSIPATDYKAPQRKEIEEQGYHIIANIGDQPSDLAGEYADKTFLLPNPFYRIP